MIENNESNTRTLFNPSLITIIASLDVIFQIIKEPRSAGASGADDARLAHHLAGDNDALWSIDSSWSVAVHSRGAPSAHFGDESFKIWSRFEWLPALCPRLTRLLSSSWSACASIGLSYLSPLFEHACSSSRSFSHLLAAFS